MCFLLGLQGCDLFVLVLVSERAFLSMFFSRCFSLDSFLSTYSYDPYELMTVVVVIGNGFRVA